MHPHPGCADRGQHSWQPTRSLLGLPVGSAAVAPAEQWGSAEPVDDAAAGVGERAPARRPDPCPGAAGTRAMSFSAGEPGGGQFRCPRLEQVRELEREVFLGLQVAHDGADWLSPSQWMPPPPLAFNSELAASRWRVPLVLTFKRSKMFPFPPSTGCIQGASERDCAECVGGGERWHPTSGCRAPGRAGPLSCGGPRPPSGAAEILRGNAQTQATVPPWEKALCSPSRQLGPGTLSSRERPGGCRAQ